MNRVNRTGLKGAMWMRMLDGKATGCSQWFLHFCSVVFDRPWRNHCSQVRARQIKTVDQ